MPTITIDGKECDFEGRKTILQVALESGVQIPYYCYHPGLSIVASCRICLAEVEAPNPRNDDKLELMPKLMPACQTSAAAGMVVYTKSPKAIANQKAVMEYLLINHPLDCPVCDQAGECYLQDYSYTYGRAVSRFMEDKEKQPKKDLGPHVLLYADRCIMCSRCVRFTQEVTGTGEIGVVGRGDHEQIDIFPGKPLDNELSGNVVDICPVGALLDKEFLFAQRVWYLSQTPSIDGITASGDNIWIHHNEQRIYRVKPRENLEVNRWWISDEIRYGWKFIHHEDRLCTPRRQQYGNQIESDWNNCYEVARDQFKRIIREGGAGSLALMVSPMLASEEAYLLGKFIGALDPQAALAVGPIPIEGEDKTFPGGYTVRAEKCPNSRGVRRALELLDPDVLGVDQLVQKLTDKNSKIAGVLVTGGYPKPWVSKDLVRALGKKFVVLIDVMANDLSAKADVLLPGATWAEKSGTFENALGRIQSFQQAIAAPEGTRGEGQIALDLMAACSLAPRSVFDAEATRTEMGGAFVEDVHHPRLEPAKEPDMQYVQL